MYVPAIIIFLCSTCSFVCWELKVNMMWCAASRVGLLVCTRSSQTTPMSSHLVLVAQSIWGPESFTYGIDEIFLKHSASSPPESMTSQPQMGYCCKNPFKPNLLRTNPWPISWRHFRIGPDIYHSKWNSSIWAPLHFLWSISPARTGSRWT